MSKNIFHILIVLAMISWGTSWISTKVLTNYVNAYELVFLRFGICFISMIPIIYMLRLSFKIDFKSSILVLIASFILVLYSIAIFWGVEHGTGSLGGALVPTLIPINTFVLIAIINRKTISLKHSFALILGSFGVLNILDIWDFDLNEIFSKDNIWVKRPGTGELPAERYSDLLGMKAASDIPANVHLSRAMIGEQ